MKKIFVPYMLFVLTQCLEGVWALECSENEHTLNDLKCCKKCMAGEGMVTPCGSSTDTVCAPCRRGETFSPQPSHDRPCIPCRICPQYSFVAHQCNETHDTVCECDRNYYYSEDTQQCRQCQLCPLSYGVRRKCETTRNTLCGPCTPGTYSDEISGERCKECTSCDPLRQITERTCDSISDTKCKDLMIQLPITEAPPSLVFTVPAPIKPKEEPEADTRSILIPACIAGLGIIVIISVVCVVIKFIKNRKNAGGNGNTGRSLKDVSYSPVSAAQTSDVKMTTVVGAKGSDSGVGSDIEPTTRVKELSEKLRIAIADSLHSGSKTGSCWSAFAAKLGFSPAKITSFETRASEEGGAPSWLVLQEWACNTTATVEALMQVLRQIGRDDVVALIYNHTRHPHQYAIQAGHIQHQAPPYQPMGQAQYSPAPAQSHYGQVVHNEMHNFYNPHVQPNVHLTNYGQLEPSQISPAMHPSAPPVNHNGQHKFAGQQALSDHGSSDHKMDRGRQGAYSHSSASGSRADSRSGSREDSYSPLPPGNHPQVVL